MTAGEQIHESVVTGQGDRKYRWLVQAARGDLWVVLGSGHARTRVGAIAAARRVTRHYRGAGRRAYRRVVGP